MTLLEKRRIIDGNNLSREFYFTSLVREAYMNGIVLDSDVESIQLRCMEFLAHKSEEYTGGESSSIRVETAENIMRSNLYTVGLYLKSLPDADLAAKELKAANIFEMYQKGRKLINAKFHAAKHIYLLAQKNKLLTPNHSYNSTLSESGIGIFFNSYDPDYEAHECPASIDYQLCNPVTDLAGVEFIRQYVGNLYLENEFCGNFAAKDIHRLLYGYDEGYKDLLINIFQHVLTAVLGCFLANRSVVKLNISAEDVRFLYNKLSKCDDQALAGKLYNAANEIIEQLAVTELSLRRYIRKSLPKIISDIAYAVKTNCLERVFVSPVNPESRPRIHFVSRIKMDDEDYRKLIDELLMCQYTSDKLALIEENVKSFDDLEEILLDAQLREEEIILVLDTLKDTELAALIRRHPFHSNIQAEELSAKEELLRLCLNDYVNQLADNRREHVLQTASRII